MSRTDPESGHLNRPGKPKGPHYLCHTSQDTDHGIILDVITTPGNANDNTTYLEQLERIHRQLTPIEAATADAAYSSRVSSSGAESASPAVPELPKEDAPGTAKRDILDDLSNERNDAIAGLLETLTPAQRHTAIDAINRVYDEPAEKLKIADSTSDTAELFNQAQRGFEDIVTAPEKVMSTQSTQGSKSFILLSVLLALLEISCATLSLRHKHSKKPKAVALVAAVAAVVVFFLASVCSLKRLTQMARQSLAT